MWRRLGLVALALVLLPLPVRGVEPVERAIPVVDLAVHLPHQLVSFGRPITTASGQADAVRMRRGGVIGVVLPLDSRNSRGLESAYFSVYRALAESGELRIPGCRRPGPGIRTWLSIDDASAVAENEVGLWSARGVRFFRLASNRSATLHDSERALVNAIVDERGVVDVSRLSPPALREASEIARAKGVPVVATEIGARSLVDDYRNLNDDQLRDVAASGGVVGVSFNPRQLARGHDAELKDVVRTVRYLVRVAGADHVSLSSGYEGGPRPPHELLNASRYPRLGNELTAAGLPRETVRKVFTTNALRVLCPPNKQR